MKTSEGITRARCAMKTNFNSFLKFKIFGHPTWFWGSLVPQSGIKPRPMAVKASSSILWTAREIPKTNLLFWGFTILRESESASHLVCPALCDPIHCSPPGSSVYGILQARILEWVAIPFSWGSSQLRDWTWVSLNVGRFFTIWATREAHPYRREWKKSLNRNSSKTEPWTCSSRCKAPSSVI